MKTTESHQRPRCTRSDAHEVATCAVHGAYCVDCNLPREAGCPACEMECPWTSASECAMARERSVAGVSDTIPSCAVHP